MDPFLLLIRAHGLPLPQQEYPFLKPTRKFIADYCWPDAMLIIEKNGQIWKKGGHSSGRGLLRDYEKSNLAQMQGWTYLQFTPQQLERGDALPYLRDVFGGPSDVDSPRGVGIGEGRSQERGGYPLLDYLREYRH